MLIMVNVLNKTISFSADSMTENMNDQAEHRMSGLGGLVNAEIHGFTSSTISTTKALAQQINQTARDNGGSPLSRDEVKRLNLYAMESNDKISAIYSQFEANAYDGVDSQYRGNLEHSTNQGTLEIYYYKEDGEIFYAETEDADDKYIYDTDEFGVRETEWYLCSMDRIGRAFKTLICMKSQKVGKR